MNYTLYNNILETHHLDTIPLFEKYFNSSQLLDANLDYQDYKDFLTNAFNEEQAIETESKPKEKQNYSLQYDPETNEVNSFGRLHDLYVFGLYRGYEDEYGNITNDLDEESKSELSDFLDDVQTNYENAIGRHSDYRCNLKSHIGSGCGIVYLPFEDDISCLVGFVAGTWGYAQKELDIFMVSHFAPTSLRNGYELIQKAANDTMPIVFAVPKFLSNQLEKAGFKYVCTIKQYFNGEYVDKDVMINKAVTKDDINDLYELFQNEADDDSFNDDEYNQDEDDNEEKENDIEQENEDDDLQNTQFEDVK